ncbi:Hypothetical predicted protein, partial [Marmota monax]
DGPKRTENSSFSAELGQALAVIEDLIKSCELAVDLAAVSGCPDDIGKLGKLLMHGPFNVWTIHKDRYKMKDFIRFKPSQRQIYLFERGIVFCKIRMEPGDQGPSPHYSFKKWMKLVTLSIRPLGRGSHKKFEIANRNGLEKYILQLSGLFQSEDSYETCSPKTVSLEKGENTEGGTEERDEKKAAPSSTEGSAGVSPGLPSPAGETTDVQAQAVRAIAASPRLSSTEN